jgi:hypothetical protein
MADTGKQSPLGVNVLGSILNNTGLNINPVAASYMGASKTNSSYTFGTLVQNTVLRLLTWAINDGWVRGAGNSGATKTLSNATYNNLISIGSGTIPGLGNSKPPTYIADDPAGIWTTLAVIAGGGLPGPATSGYPITSDIDQGQQATWIPYNTSNPNKSVTQWGYIRLHALQAWYEFNWNGTTVDPSSPEYKEFASSYLSANGFVNYSNQAILAMHDAPTFLEGVYSNMSDLISADVAGVNLSSINFGTDLINLGKAISLSNIATFGLPSNLLETLGKSSAITQDLSLALIASGLTSTEISAISSGTIPNVTKEQEQKIFGAFLIITGENLRNVLAPLQCNTQGLTNLADLLNVKKLFPISYSSLTVPVYNAAQGLPTNSKTYYLIYNGDGVNSALDSQQIRDYVGTQVPDGTPPIFDNTTNPNQFKELPKGFGSYLKDVIPADLAIAAGAFSYSIRQIRNIQYCDFSKFARTVKGMENTTDLSLTNGTDKPTNQALAKFGTSVCALGTGPYGTYTMSDFFGCMSGLPYPWELIYGRINQLTTTKLRNIYHELYLAVTWEKAQLQLQQPYYYTTSQAYVAPTVSNNPANPAYQPDPMLPNYNPNPYLNGSTGAETTCATYYSAAGQPAKYDWYYTLKISQTKKGGGYSRGTAPNPTVTISPNNVSASVIGNEERSDANAGSNGGGTFGRITASINNGNAYRWLANDTQTNWVNKAGQDTCGNSPTAPIIPPRDAAWAAANMPIESISIQHPPTAGLPVSANGSIATNGTNTSGDTWNRNGQSASGTVGWQSPMNSVVQGYIDQANAEIASIQSKNTDGSVHLNTYWNVCGRQLKVEQRSRYTAISPVPVPKDYFMTPYPITLYGFVDSVPSLSQDTRPHMNAQTIEAISNLSTPGGQSTVAMTRQERNQTRLQQVGIELDNNMPSTLNTGDFKTVTTNGTLAGATEGILSPNGQTYTHPSWPRNITPTNSLVPNPSGIYIPNPTVFEPGAQTSGYQPTSGTKPGDVTPIITGDPNPVVNPLVPIGPIVNPSTINITDSTNTGGGTNNTGNTGGGSSATIGPDGNPIPIVIIQVPTQLDPNNLSPNLDPNYISSTLFPSTPSIETAINQVIACNCDCWVR